VAELLLENVSKINFHNLPNDNQHFIIVDMIKEESKRYWNNDWDEFLSSIDSDDAIQLLMDNREKTRCNWIKISTNTNDKAVEFLRLNPDNISGVNLSSNHSNKMLMLLKTYPEKIYWMYLSANPADVALDILAEHPDRIEWNQLSVNENPRVMELFLKYPQKINYSVILKNSAIFVMDYDAMKCRISPFKEELIAAVFHPRRMLRLMDMIGDDDDIEDFF
jgi:hypothetical protein